MLTIRLRNTGKHPQFPTLCDYEYIVDVNGRIIESGTVNDHTRADGWRALLLKLAQLEDERVP